MVVQAWYQKVLFYVGDFEKALETMTETLKRFYSEDPTMRNIRGLLFLVEGCEEDAIKYFERAVNSNKEGTDAWVNWSIALLKQGKKREAMEILKKEIDFIEKGVNVKDEMKEIIGHYKHLSDMLEKKVLQESDEKAKINLEKVAVSIKLLLKYLESPNFDTIFNEEVEKKKDENLEGEASKGFGTTVDASMNNNDFSKSIDPISNYEIEENEFKHEES